MNTHKNQINFLTQLKSKASSTDEMIMIHDITTSVYDSASHYTESPNMVRVEMSHSRYVKYMKLIVNPENVEPENEKV